MECSVKVTALGRRSYAKHPSMDVSGLEVKIARVSRATRAEMRDNDANSTDYVVDVLLLFLDSKISCRPFRKYCISLLLMALSCNTN